MKSLVFGAGRQGKAIAYALGVLGLDSFISDVDPEQLRSLPIGVQKFHNLHYFKTLKPDIVVSALPYTETYRYATLCINEGIRYCDLGGNVETSQKINEFAEKYGSVPVMTDLGLAPGLINIIAEYLVSKIISETHLVPRGVNMYVGGLPQAGYHCGPLKYGIVFSPEGLVNEYVSIPFVLKDGLLLAAEPMGDINYIGSFDASIQAFNTSGGAHTTLESLHKKGVQNCRYQTLRYDGHIEKIRFLYNDCRLTRKELAKAITNCCPELTDDCAILLIRIDNVERFRCSIFPENGFTAMQRGTAFPAAVVAYQIAQGLYDDLRAVKYCDLEFDEFFRLLSDKNLLPEIEI
jgi:saccharopine dehydrogenase-like NADP-dependent oxidoreductase